MIFKEVQKQLHVVANAAVTSGGEGLAAFQYSKSVARAGGKVLLLSKGLPSGDISESFEKGEFTMQVAPSKPNLLFELLTQHRCIQSLCEQEKFNLVHIHGMWSPFLAIVAQVARRKNIPIIISPHGCLEPWALKYKYWKKWLALKFYQGAILRSASLFVATANQELESIRRLDLSQPVAVIPNGVQVKKLNLKVKHEIKTILFLSRIHPKKGLLDLVNAWGGCHKRGWKVVIAGGDEDGYLAKVKDLIQKRKLQSYFEFLGFVEGDRKQACFDLADIFVLPTYSENFGIVVAEALANELPVITTTGAPWQDLVNFDCGWWITPGEENLTKVLRESMEYESKTLREMGRRGRELVIDKYSWDKIGSVAIEVTQWLLRPSRLKPEVVKEYK